MPEVAGKRRGGRLVRIVHLDLAGFYTEDTLYQTNLLARFNLRDGHEVTIISTVYHWKGADIVKVPPCDMFVEGGVRLSRLEYANPDPAFARQKFRKVRNLYAALKKLEPDIIFCHCLQFWSVLDVVRYKKDHPEVKLYADTHAAAYNSGTNRLSLHVLHRGLYRHLTQRALPYLEKYFYITEASRRFSVQNYGVPESLMEFYPLGGTLPPEEEYQADRAELGLAENTPLLVHSSKLDALKRTDALLRAFAAVPELNAGLAVIGSIPEDRKELLTSLMDADGRVAYLGWRSGEELGEYLCACDLYCQSGSESATLQNAMCRGCPVLSYPHEDYTKDLDYGNILWAKTEDEITEAFRRLAENPALLETLREGSRRCARELLDYRKLAARLYGNAAGEGGLKTAKEDELMNAGHADTAATPISRQRTAPPGLVIYGNSFSRLNAAPGRKISRFSVAFPAPRNERTESGVPSRPAPAPQIGGARP